MRRKKLDVVFDENVNELAEQLTDFVARNHKRLGKTNKANKSELLRVAMYLGLKQLKSEIEKIDAADQPINGFLKINGIRAMLGVREK